MIPNYYGMLGLDLAEEINTPSNVLLPKLSDNYKKLDYLLTQENIKSLNMRSNKNRGKSELTDICNQCRAELKEAYQTLTDFNKRRQYLRDVMSSLQTNGGFSDTFLNQCAESLESMLPSITVPSSVQEKDTQIYKNFYNFNKDNN